ncbi:hypothetical protein NP590_09950 [Methylomonas sp. SURF-2]|uniref:Uncharacterized protein n=1 Tax=Methylomonas subterranea TaxID=2952225 RepID=A0ABT1TGH9_9GAMM|nr:hypothetical protein [Methylomonas sp. SURF-2]MCQ8104424.1 hypothetical protein [Methylomonas sp. SURF-2]
MNHVRIFTLFLLLLCQPHAAAGFDDKSVPEVLKAWIPWVLSDQAQFDCPFFHNDFQQKNCSWPGPLKLELQDGNGSFSGEWTLYQPAWISLPGDSRHWPQQVSINQKPAVVTARQDKPAIWMPAGQYQVSGTFNWDKLPESLAIADDSGLIQLSLNGKSVAYPRLDQGALWLRNQIDTSAATQQDSLDIQVFRQIMDDNPLQVSTRLELNVSGRAREISLPYALLPSFIPVLLDSPLPARLEADGRLLLQVRPGHWRIGLLARHPQALSQLDLSIQDPTWPESELWAFQAMPGLRLVEIEALPAVDPSQTNLPEEWQHLPTYQIKQGQSMRFKLIRRGDPEPEPNQLSLQRKLWLDFDGAGYSVSDQINGKMSRDWRLNALTDTRLGQVLLNGQNQLITQLSDKRQGVEVRRGDIQLQADSRIEAGITQLNAVGWQESFQSAQAELNIPPGWRLLAVGGVDNDPDSWLSRWSLLDLFLVLIVALAVTRLWCWQWGLLALLSLTLFWHETEAPQWIWLHTLAALALLKALPENRFSRWVKWYRNLCWLGLAIIVIPFMIAQIRFGIYPQLERPWQPIQPSPYAAQGMVAGEDYAEESLSMAAPASSAPRVARKLMGKAYSSVADAVGAANFDRIDPEANLQTGPGLPQWQWQTVHLSWNGAVDSQQQLRLWYLSPTWNLLLHILQALLAALLSLKMLNLIDKQWRIGWPNLTAWLLLPLLVAPTGDSWADMPDQALLDQLKARLLRAPECLPSCAQIADMTIHIKPDDMRIELSIHAREALALPLPAQLKQWFPEQISNDGHPAQTLLRQDDGTLWLGLERGVHQVILRGRHTPQYKFTLPLALPPQRTQIDSEGWRVDGLYEDGKTGPQLEFTRLNPEANQAADHTPQTAMPAFVRIERTLQLGLDWRIATRVVKLAGSDGPVVLELPLLAGEAVTSAQIRVKDGKVLVNLPAGQTSLEWQSLLEKREQLQLTAADNPAWSELWRADVSPIWHLQPSGIAVVHHQDQQGAWLPEWRPWPGESVSLHISRPQAVPGSTLTIDKSQLSVVPGKRSQQVSLEIQLRSSKGGQHNLLLPPQAVLQSVAIDGVVQPVRQKERTVTLPIRPGAQQIALSWQTPSEQSPLLTTPEVDLGIASVNSHLRVSSGEDRWVLLTFGPKFGPAALIWGLLPVLLLLAAGLDKTNLTPLKTRHWFLLLLGLSQIHIAAGLVVVGWIFALGWREKFSPQTRGYFNLAQVGLGLLTLLSVSLLFSAVQQGLLGAPDMQITGNQSTPQNLNWYQDHSTASLPTATVIALPLTVYRLLMLGWSLWMALALLNWLQWGWSCFARGGIWKHKTASLPAKTSE